MRHLTTANIRVEVGKAEPRTASHRSLPIKGGQPLPVWSRYRISVTITGSGFAAPDLITACSFLEKRSGAHIPEPSPPQCMGNFHISDLKLSVSPYGHFKRH
ncbi:hypothetical protein CDAR_4221 [Caerostris darwini]|uniref:Uncharacterized protein n=1 Tax=Caerostris darwini TaxID=1538125 RepID=A0AAV4N6Q8_9ARAC|nr:hypothetical protein CDAR_4221 [Caerostris darwini]